MCGKAAFVIKEMYFQVSLLLLWQHFLPVSFSARVCAMKPCIVYSQSYLCVSCLGLISITLLSANQVSVAITNAQSK